MPTSCKIYELIWKRTMASQMVDARVLRTTLEISAQGPGRRDGGADRERQGDRVRRLPPRLRRRQRRSGGGARGAGSDPAAVRRSAIASTVTAAPPITLLGTEPKRHETTPPARFTEASLIKELERLGIGRPSTYAPTIATIVRRGYVFRQGKALVPSFTAFAVTKLLRDHFGDFVETDFTAEMEEDLDEISRGERESDRVPAAVLLRRQASIAACCRRSKQGAEKADYPVLDLGADPESGEPVRVRIGRFGPFVQVGEGGPGRTASLPDDVAPADLTRREGARAGARQGRRAAHARRRSGDRAERLRDERPLRRLRAARRNAGSRRRRRRQKAVEKPKRASLQAGMTESTVTLEEALKLLSLPRVVGLHPDDNEPIVDELRPLRSVREARRRVPLARVGRRRVRHLVRRGAGAAARAEAVAAAAGARQKKTLRELTQDGTTLKVLAGRYGPYVTDGTTNASIPKAMNPEALTLRAGAGAARGAPGRGADAARGGAAARAAKPRRPTRRARRERRPARRCKARAQAQGQGRLRPGHWALSH